MNMRITLLQTNITWTNKSANLTRVQEILAQIQGQTDLLVLPETFTTGFDPSVTKWAETTTGNTIITLQKLADDYKIALTGSYVSYDPLSCHHSQPYYYNRAFFLVPQSAPVFYDKRHLFSMGGEKELFQKGNKRPIIRYRGWKIFLQICYDLRFPVWSRNLNGNQYDLLIYVANWPRSRRQAWDILLPARAIENQCFVCGVNRVGIDNRGCHYNGGSALYSPQGQVLGSVPDDKEGTVTTELNLDELQSYRTRFPTYLDMDAFAFEDCTPQ